MRATFSVGDAFNRQGAFGETLKFTLARTESYHHEQQADNNKENQKKIRKIVISSKVILFSACLFILSITQRSRRNKTKEIE